MRTQLLCALAILAGGEVASAQSWPSYPSYGGQGQGYAAAYPGSGYPGSGYVYPNYTANQQYSTYQQVYALPPSPMVAPPGPEAMPEAPAEEDKAACSGPRFWVNISYVMLFLQPQKLATPLATTGSTADTAPGALNQPGTRILFGDEDIDYGMFNGIRPEIGTYLDPECTVSVEWVGLFVAPRSVNFSMASDAAGNPLITRPFFSAVTSDERAFLDAFPGTAAGSIAIESRAELFGSEMNARCNFNPKERFQTDALLGFRFLRFKESLVIHDELTPLANNLLTFQRAPVNAPDSLVDTDKFATINRFYGLQLGGRLRWEGDWCSASAFTKFGIGATSQEVNINGATALLTGAGPQFAGGGILALPTNIGSHSRTVIGFIPEAGVNFGVKVTRNIQVTAGYSFLFWNEVVRPGSQIDRVVSPNLVPTDASFGPAPNPARPAFQFSDESLWIHTLTCGVGVTF